jgi:AraC-like DNA-binding protein
MIFKRVQPNSFLENYIDCFWVIESEDHQPVKQKIIPDGFPEIIFHYRDPYRININGSWQLQAKGLLAGQIKKHFFLENTGTSGVFGIKFKPAALSHLFGFSMHAFTDNVLPIEDLDNTFLNLLGQEIQQCHGYAEMIEVAEKRFKSLVENTLGANAAIDAIADLIFQTNGSVSIIEIQKAFFTTERQLQRLFHQYIGISPKFYCRIIRFNHVFQLMQQGKFSWLDITHRAGYFDQSHFIRDFKAFTGEDPSKYFFNDPNLANFFLKKAGS